MLPLTVLITALPAVPVSLVASVMINPTHDCWACPVLNVALMLPVVPLMLNADPVVAA